MQDQRNAQSDQAMKSISEVDLSAVVKSCQLIPNGKELMIEHGNEIYRLRITKQDKLILTK